MPQTASVLDVAREVMEVEAAAIRRVADLLDDSFERAVRMLTCCEGRVVVSGMGKSGIVGQKISATLASTGTPSLSLHPAEAVHGDLGRVVRGDCLIALSNGGETEELLRLIDPVKRIGAPILAITGNPRSTLARHADIVLSIGKIDEACSLGLAPTASTTAMLALGDALAMAVARERNFTREEYALYHPGGRLGRSLLSVREIMRTGDANPVVSPETPVKEVLFAITRARAGWAVVVAPDGMLAGIFTDGDLRRHLEKGGAVLADPVGIHMTKKPFQIAPERLASEALAILKAREVDGLPVVEADGRPVGWLDVQDLLQAGLV
ncbi:MAG: KpsF/GutQ family sugar-phosphate isomerase [Planctomycetes bacterium]|nr:KpsF/GutQ family sugar-phosphate isomerase [Planctomycetota bacterium]